ncbi:MAG: ankyrin repeat domain-containing protein [Candidatus Abyssobacteria bacterium SURF_5]|uniref:Ankyrin repeat domain-containing protein n=1 Tax=Abyssobacteria bacterium (strain SURF_5) TaxID=2093360 RepID=A0A3A4NS11_ABYX5|nr:MAG: ankyrin repeat domain-containing protein [Candidatus Abyssubacteria bacterium SURF_5]
MQQQPPETRWLRLKEETNALDYLERASLFIRETPENTKAWKWVIIALHGALYGFAVAAACGTDDTSLNRGRGKLLGIWDVLKLCQDPNHMKMLSHSKHLHLTESQRKSVELMVSELRNEFAHFKPKLWSIELHGMPDIAVDVLEVIRFLALETNTYIHLTQKEMETVNRLVEQSTTFLQKTQLYEENRLAENLSFVARKKLELANVAYTDEEFVSQAAQGNTQTVELFMASGMDPDIRNSKGVTALMCATMNGHVETIKALLANGAEVDVKAEDGVTAIKIAESKSYKEIEEILRLARFSFMRRNIFPAP